MTSGLALRTDIVRAARLVPFPEVDSRAVSELYCVRTATLVDPQSILDIGLGRLTRACDCANNNDHRSADNR
jgi:hypothetical protein